MINEQDIKDMDDNNVMWEYYTQEAGRGMSLNDYQNMASKTAIYSLQHQILYPALGLAGEAGEVANKVKKMIRDNKFDRDGIAAELGDVLWYVSALARDLNIDMQDLAMQNLEKLYSRKERGTLGGNGDNR
jgi:NTP pyrophosphatase (non-canonical NTP hydrolase)